MTWDAWMALIVVAGTVGTLTFTRIGSDLVLVAALTALMVTGVLSPAAALAGLSNPGLATVGVLYVVVAGIRDTGAIHAVGLSLLGRPRSTAEAQLRLMLPVTAMSAFLNNTPVVAMMVPVVQDWCKRNQASVSKLMIPLSYAAILGGTCTLIGTSTNLIVYGLVLKDTQLGAMSLFEIAWVGLPCAVIGVSYVLFSSRWLLPERRGPLQELQNPREYSIEMLVSRSSPLVGKTIEEAGLRHLPGAYLAEVERGDSVIPAVAPTERLRADDRLMFVGIVESVVDLVKVKGLIPASDQIFKLDAPRAERCLIEAVISDTCPAVGQTIRDARFRSRYEAVVIAVARNGERVGGKVGDIVLRPGDTTLIEARPSFVEQQRNSRDFLLVSPIEGSAPPRHERAWIAIAILAGMVAIATSEVLSMLEAAMIAAGFMILTRCTTGPSARANVDWSVLTVIGASIGLGQALQSSGAAQVVAEYWVNLAGDSPWLSLLAIYVITSFFTEVVTNNAAAVLVFPIAQATAESLGVSFWPFVVCIMMGASASFATPIGYQTNLMVYGPGGYHFRDYLRIGVPLNLLLAVVTVGIAPLVWPF
ncbi:MAG: potassium transporter TrkA [Elusimicrobia bacterium RBG_16_66_12]|nr:MAG: potassium transporter TrkA [Elusimicrobia bacterium RBG_16_66_12]